MGKRRIEVVLVFQYIWLFAFFVFSIVYSYLMYFRIIDDDKLKKNLEKGYRITLFISIAIVLSKTVLDAFLTYVKINDIIVDTIKNFIENQYALKNEIIMLIMVAALFIFTKYVLPFILEYMYRVNEKNYIKSYRSKIVYNMLPNEKVKSCIYSTNENMDNASIVKAFQDLYIPKKVYIDGYNNKNSDYSERVFNYEEYIINGSDNHFFLLGDAGCGKSTLLFHLFIYYIQKMDSQKIIPIFIDLYHLNPEQSLEELIVNNLYVICENMKGYAFLQHYQRLEDKKVLIERVFKAFYSEGYQFIFLFDSLDEYTGHDDEVVQTIRHFKEKLNNVEKKLNYKLLIALRKNWFENHKEMIEDNMGEYLVFNTKDYDQTETEMFIDRLIEKNIIQKSSKDQILKNIDLVTFDEKVNPFILSLIVKSYFKTFDRAKNIQYENKIVKLIQKNIKGLIYDVNNRHKGIRKLSDYDETYEIIGVLTLFKDKKNIEISSSYLSTFFQSDTDVCQSTYIVESKILRDETYLLDKNHHFYQKIFAEYYCAKYIMETIFNIENEKYLIIIDALFKKGQFNEIFEYIILLTDYELSKVENSKKITQFNYSAINQLLEYMFHKYTMDATAENEYIIFEKIQCMIKILDKYSRKRIVQDKVPISIDATFDSDFMIRRLYKVYFGFIIKNKLTIDYGYFYNVLTIVDKHHLAVDAIIELNQEDACKESLFFMLSIIRDSYLNLHFQRKEELFFKNHVYSDADMLMIQNLCCHSKNISDMDLRELLNYTFYHYQLIDAKKIKIDIRQKLFPTIYNLEYFISNYTKKKTVHSVCVSEEDNLIFDSNQSYYSIYFIKTDTLKDIKVTIESHKVSAFFYIEKEKKLYNNIKNTSFIKTIDIDDGIEILEDNCFDKSEELINIILPNTLQKIGAFALYACHRLNHLNLPNNIMYIGDSFVEDCYSLERVVLPQNLKKLGEYAFERATSLKEIVFNEGLVDLNDGLLNGCTSINGFLSLNISKQIRILPKFMFINCESIEEIDLREYEQLEQINHYAFSGCSNLKKIMFPQSLKKMGMLVFHNCPNLTFIEFNSTVEISKHVFANLNHSLSISISGKNMQQVNHIDSFNQFLEDNGFQFTSDKYMDEVCFVNETNSVASYEFSLDFSFNKQLDVFDSHTYAGLKIVKTGIGAFGNHRLLNDVIFDENLRELSEWLFEDCKSLYSVNLKNTMISKIPRHCFENCDVLKEVVLPNQITEIADYAFENCFELERMIYINRPPRTENGLLLIPSSIKTIGELAFHNCNKIKKIVIESNDTEISSFAFDRLKNLEEVVLPKDTSRIQNNAFADCPKDVKISGVNISTTEKNRIFSCSENK